MIPLKLLEISRIIGANRVVSLPDVTVSGISIDTRTLKKGDLYFAIKGRRLDGHDYVVEAVERGACAVVAQGATPEISGAPAGGLLRVDDTLAALGRLGHHCRLASDAVFIAVTGSNGKTTVKDMIQGILSRRMHTVSSPKSFNNFIGVPLTLMNVEPDTQAVVVEVGTNSPGEIAHLADMVMPHIAVLTNVGLTHLAGLKDLEGVAEEKTSMLGALPEDGLAVLNADEPFFAMFRSLDPGSVAWWGLQGEADFTAREIVHEGEATSYYLNGTDKIVLGCPGRHNVANSLAAIAVARKMGVGMKDIAAALADFTLPSMRLQREDVEDVTIINDAYNANPHSVGAAISVLDNAPARGKKILVLGEMAELGEESRNIHRSIGKVVRASGVDCLIGVGGEARYICESASSGGSKLRALFCPDIGTALEALTEIVGEGDTVLFKASRASRLERLINSFKQQLLYGITDAVCPIA